MSIAVEAEQVVAGFINTTPDKTNFTLEDIYDYIGVLWNAGCGPVRLNFTRNEMIHFLDSCDGICLRKTSNGWCIDKSLLSDAISENEKNFLRNNKELAKSFDLFCRLQVDFRTPYRLLDAMGYQFLYT